MPPDGIPNPASPPIIPGSNTIVVNGVMYLPSAIALLALEPESGKEIGAILFKPARLRSAVWLTGREIRTTRPGSCSLPSIRWSR